MSDDEIEAQRRRVDRLRILERLAFAAWVASVAIAILNLGISIGLACGAAGMWWAR